jgi:hypothetical protein
MADLREQKQITAELEKQKEILKAHNEESQAYKQAVQEINRLNVERVRVENEIAEAQRRVSAEAGIVSLEKEIDKFRKSALNSLNEQLGLTGTLDVLQDKLVNGSEEEVKNATRFTQILNGISDGTQDLESVLNIIATEDLGEMNQGLKDVADMIRKTPDLTDKLRIENDTIDAANRFQQNSNFSSSR